MCHPCDFASGTPMVRLKVNVASGGGGEENIFWHDMTGWHCQPPSIHLLLHTETWTSVLSPHSQKCSLFFYPLLWSINNYKNGHSSCGLSDPAGWNGQKNRFHKKPSGHCAASLCVWLDPISSLEHNHNRYTATAFFHPHEFASI